MKEQLKAFLEAHKPTVEAVKELGRYIVLFLTSGLIVQLTNQLVKVPESQSFNIWVFTIDIPVRLAFQLVFVGVGRFVDKALYEISKANGTVSKFKGLVGF